MLPATGPTDENPITPKTGYVPNPIAAAPIAAFSVNLDHHPVFYY